MRLANKIGLVTGAGSGIGRAIARRFASEGASLALSDIAEDGLQATLSLISEAGGQAIAVKGDVAVRADAEPRTPGLGPQHEVQVTLQQVGHGDVERGEPVGR